MLNNSNSVSCGQQVKMPGHIKKSSGPDPDPSQWLFVSYELKQKLKVRFQKIFKNKKVFDWH